MADFPQNEGSALHLSISGEHFDFPTAWDVVLDVRKLTKSRLTELSTELRDATTITVTELAENLVKYSEGSDVCRLQLELEVTSNRICVRSENRGVPAVRAKGALKIIENIAEHPDATELYAQAIEDSLARDVDATRLGFYRIAAVGSFALRAKYDDEKRLVVWAERSI